MEKYLAYDSINGETGFFDNIEQAREWLKESFLCDGEYHPDLKDCAIYKLVETVDYEVIDKKSNYKYEYEDDIPYDDNESEAWPYNTEFDEIWKHRFVSV